jgi:hypothetical protein
MLRPCSDEALTIWPVGKAVGNVKNTGSRLLMPVEAARKPDHIHAMLVSLETLWGVGENKNDDRSETQNSSRQEWPRQAQAAGRGAGRSPQEYLSGIRSNFGRTARPRPARIGGLVNALTTPGEIRQERRKRAVQVCSYVLPLFPMCSPIEFLGTKVRGKSWNPLILLVSPAGFEPTTP